jgi:pyruvate formate lyase activating enzyme
LAAIKEQNGADDLLALGRFVQEPNGIEKVEILPYHRMGVYKWQQLGKT